MTERAEVERTIVDDESMLEEIASLVEGRCELGRWPEDARRVLAVALEDGAMSRAETWKSVALRRHLFGPQDAIPKGLAAPQEPSMVDRRRAERVRASLPAIIRYRAGAYLR